MCTDRSGSDIRIVPTKTTLTAEELAQIFFKEWYCENGLPLDIVSNQDKLFVSQFWKALHKLTNVNLKMSSAYHPETDGASERTNKTVIQCIRFAVERDQKGLGSRSAESPFRHYEHRQRLHRLHTFPTSFWQIGTHFTPTHVTRRRQQTRHKHSRSYRTNAAHSTGSKRQLAQCEDPASTTREPTSWTNVPIQNRQTRGAIHHAQASGIQIGQGTTRS